jgi:hypothetical protein
MLGSASLTQQSISWVRVVVSPPDDLTVREALPLGNTPAGFVPINTESTHPADIQSSQIPVRY